MLQRYRHIKDGGELELTEHRPYRDYVNWFQEQDPKRAEDYWKGELAGFRTPTHLSVDRAQTSVHAPVTEYDGQKIELTTEETSALQSLAQRH